jgi:hypothetical protein
MVLLCLRFIIAAACTSQTLTAVCRAPFAIPSVSATSHSSLTEQRGEGHQRWAKPVRPTATRRGSLRWHRPTCTASWRQRRWRRLLLLRWWCCCAVSLLRRRRGLDVRLLRWWWRCAVSQRRRRGLTVRLLRRRRGLPVRLLRRRRWLRLRLRLCHRWSWRCRSTRGGRADGH